MSSPSVRVRMYRQGLGDCFLLTFPRLEQSSNFHVLIDCGVMLGTENAAQRMTDVVEDIFQATGGVLDLVIATHEHWDHLSGFVQARSIFEKLLINEVWMAWTEDPNNATARALQQARQARLTALRAALQRMTGPEFYDVRGSIEDVLSFFGEVPETVPADRPADTPDSEGEAAQTSFSRKALQYLAGRQDAIIHYCYPTKDLPHTLNGVENVRVYVFGPPEDLSLLKMSDPTQAGKQMYGVAALSAEASFFASVVGEEPKLPEGTPGQKASPYGLLQSLCYPFDNYYRISPLDARQNDFFVETYGFGKQEENAWRRIDSDWLSVTSDLALSLDSDTNNTSLVLAFELGAPGSGKVLLFAADAQVGNWLSWDKLAWIIPGAGKRITPSDLLSRTVLYKVGHHGSHNATLRQVDSQRPGGLELMIHDDLVAMIPVDQKMAAKKRWNMPFPDLYSRLQQKTRGRVLRTDIGLPSQIENSSLTTTQWNNFINSLKVTDLYIEYCVEV